MRWKNNGRAAVTISFDDGYKEAYEYTFPILVRHNMVATYNIVTSYVGGTLQGLLVASWPDWQNASKKGMEIGSHSIGHKTLRVSLSHQIRNVVQSLYAGGNRFHFLRYVGVTFLTSLLMGMSGEVYGEVDMGMADMQRECVKSKRKIESEIFTQQISSYTYPGGICNAQYKNAVRSAGYLSARSTTRGFNQYNSVDFFNLKCFMWNRYTTVREANSWVDFAMEKSAWLIEAYHLVGMRNSGLYSTLLGDFEEHLDYVHSLVRQGKLWVDTQQNVAKYLREKLSTKIGIQRLL